MKKVFLTLFVISVFIALFACQSPVDLTDEIGNGVEKDVKYVENTRLNMTSKDAYEQDDSLTSAKTITANAAAQEHNFYDDANDYLKFSATAGTTYTVETVVYGYADTVLYVRDGYTTLASNDDKGDGTYGSKVVWTAPSTKTYYIRVYSYNGKKGTNRGYTITLTGGSGGGGGSGVTLPQPSKKWTVLVYLDADNNLSSYGDYDINEMKAVGSDSNINIVVLWDNAGSTHGYYYIQSTGATLLQDVGEVNMGSETTAKNFIDFATTNFPADHYMWIFWNHGGAVDRTYKGVCWDDTNSSDHLSEVEQKSIISYLNTKRGKTLDVLAYDACLMATAELMYQFKGLVNYIASSEQTIPGNGYDYEFISYIKNNPTTTAYYAAKAIFDYYKAEYSTTSDVTFSVVNISYADELGTALDNFTIAAINSGISGTTFKNLKPTSNFSGYTWDLYVYMSNIYNSSSMTTTVKNYAKAVMDLINPANAQLVVLEWHGRTWTSKAYGVSITLKADTTIYSQLDICIDSQWDEFLTFAGF